MAVAALPVSVIRWPLEQVVGSRHCSDQFTACAPLSAASQARVVVPVFTARR